MNELLEQLAALEHEQWIHWANGVIEYVPPNRRERWERVCFVPYEQLPEELKELDRVWARRVLEVIGVR